MASVLIQGEPGMKLDPFLYFLLFMHSLCGKGHGQDLACYIHEHAEILHSILYLTLFSCPLIYYHGNPSMEFSCLQGRNYYTL